MERTAPATFTKLHLTVPRRTQGSRSSSENEKTFTQSAGLCPSCLPGKKAQRKQSSKSSELSNVVVQMPVDLSLLPPFLPATGIQPSVFRVMSDSFVLPSLQRLSSIQRTPTGPSWVKSKYFPQIVPQTDGQLGDLSVSEEPISSSPSLSINSNHQDSKKLSISHEFPDLFLPFSPEDSEKLTSDDSITPLTTATRSKASFPFPTKEETLNPLRPFYCRLPSSRLHLSQRSSSRSSFGYPSPSQTPDRFMPVRRHDTARECYELSRSPDQLTDHEKIVRSGAVAPDPFSRRVRTNAARLVSRFRTGNPSIISPRGSSNVLSFRGTGSGSIRRTISVGAI
jgi:hypothetical protein